MTSKSPSRKGRRRFESVQPYSVSATDKSKGRASLSQSNSTVARGKRHVELGIAEPAEKFGEGGALAVHQDADAVDFCREIDDAYRGDKQQDDRERDLPDGRRLNGDTQRHQYGRKKR